MNVNLADIECKNAIITGASLSNADHGVLSAWVHLSYGDSGGQGFGGFALYLPDSYKHHKKGSPYAGHFIWRVMEIADVSEWSQLTGKTVRVKADHSKVYCIGHIVKNDWFNPEIEFKQIKEATD